MNLCEQIKIVVFNIYLGPFRSVDAKCKNGSLNANLQFPFSTIKTVYTHAQCTHVPKLTYRKKPLVQHRAFIFHVFENISLDCETHYYSRTYLSPLDADRGFI